MPIASIYKKKHRVKCHVYEKMHHLWKKKSTIYKKKDQLKFQVYEKKGLFTKKSLVYEKKVLFLKKNFIIMKEKFNRGLGTILLLPKEFSPDLHILKKIN